MAGLAAVIPYGGSPSAQALSDILALMYLRGGDQYGVSDGREVTRFRKIPPPKEIPFGNSPLIGFTAKEGDHTEFSQLIEGDGFTVAGDGEIYLENDIRGVSPTILSLGENPLLSLEKFMKDFNGIFSLLLNSHGKVYALRDPLGVKPLYYGRTPHYLALASERKALWAIGIHNPVSFPPGCIGEFSKHVSIKRTSHLFQASLKEIDMESGIRMVEDALTASVRKRLCQSKSVAVAFSGGLDSSLIAYVADTLGFNVHLYSAMVRGAPEIESATAAAKLLGLPLHMEIKSVDSILTDLDKIIWFIEEPDRMKFEVAFPLYWTTSRVFRDGFKVLLSGQGSDELFAGYKKFLTVVSNKGWRGLDAAVKDAVSNSYSINFERDEPILTGTGLVGRFPYADTELVQVGLNIPSSLKISGVDDPQRKQILRKTALRIGLPQPLVEKVKKSAQYGSGVHGALTRLSKKRGTPPKKLLLHAYMTLRNKIKDRDYGT